MKKKKNSDQFEGRGRRWVSFQRHAMVGEKEKKQEKEKKIKAKGPILLAAAAAGSGSITSPVSDMQARAVEPMQNWGGKCSATLASVDAVH